MSTRKKTPRKAATRPSQPGRKTAGRKGSARKRSRAQAPKPAPDDGFLIFLDGSEPTQSAEVIELGEECKLRHVSDLHRRLLDVLANHRAVGVNADRIKEVDTAAMQLLCLFSRQASAQGIDVCWGDFSPAFSSALDGLGLDGLIPYR